MAANRNPAGANGGASGTDQAGSSILPVDTNPPTISQADSQLWKAVKAHIAKGDQARDKAEQHYIAAGQHLKTLKAAHKGTWQEWESLVKERTGIRSGRRSTAPSPMLVGRVVAVWCSPVPLPCATASPSRASVCRTRRGYGGVQHTAVRQGFDSSSTAVRQGSFRGSSDQAIRPAAGFSPRPQGIFLPPAPGVGGHCRCFGRRCGRVFQPGVPTPGGIRGCVTRALEGRWKGVGRRWKRTSYGLFPATSRVRCLDCVPCFSMWILSALKRRDIASANRLLTSLAHRSRSDALIFPSYKFA